MPAEDGPGRCRASLAVSRAPHRAHEDERPPGRVRVDERFRPAGVEDAPATRLLQTLRMEVVHRAVARLARRGACVVPGTRGRSDVPPGSTLGPAVAVSPHRLRADNLQRGRSRRPPSRPRPAGRWCASSRAEPRSCPPRGAEGSSSISSSTPSSGWPPRSSAHEPNACSRSSCPPTPPAMTSPRTTTPSRATR